MMADLPMLGALARMASSTVGRKEKDLMSSNTAELKAEFIPLPAKALPEPEGAGGYRLQRAGENGYVVISGFVQSVFVVTKDGVVVVDAPPALDGKLQAAIRSVTDKAV